MPFQSGIARSTPLRVPRPTKAANKSVRPQGVPPSWRKVMVCPQTIELDSEELEEICEPLQEDEAPMLPSIPKIEVIDVAADSEQLEQMRPRASRWWSAAHERIAAAFGKLQ